MRDHGIADFPDPDSEGRRNIEASQGSALDPASSQFKAAFDACKSLQPQVKSDQKAQNQAALLQYAKCMRDHGIVNFPDPQPDGSLFINSSMGIDDNSPQYQAADQACQQYQPAP